jgi:hypothetical protein
MIDTVLNLLFRCSHRRLSRPVSPASKKGVAQGAAYEVCLDCGKHFAYDTDRMILGKRLEDDEVVPRPKPEAAKPAMPKLKYALWASLLLAVLLGSILRTRKPRPEEPAPGRKPGAPR